eukprot:3108551-Rhodomonas_salina.3
MSLKDLLISFAGGVVFLDNARLNNARRVNVALTLLTCTTRKHGSSQLAYMPSTCLAGSRNLYSHPWSLYSHSWSLHSRDISVHTYDISAHAHADTGRRRRVSQRRAAHERSAHARKALAPRHRQLLRPRLLPAVARLPLQVRCCRGVAVDVVVADADAVVRFDLCGLSDASLGGVLISSRSCALLPAYKHSAAGTYGMLCYTSCTLHPSWS